MPAKHSDRLAGEKLLALYTYLMLKGETRTSLAELANILNCSKQTVLRLLAQIEAAGYGKLEEPMRIGKEHFYRMSKFSVPNLDVGISDLAQLAMCRNILLSVLPKDMLSIFDLRKPGKDKTDNQELAKKTEFYTFLHKGVIDYKPFEEIFKKFVNAIRTQLACEVTYRKSPLAEPRTFLFAPVRIISYHETISIRGFELEAKTPHKALYTNPANLYLQRVQKIKTLKSTCSNLPAIEPHNENAFGIMPGKLFRVRLSFSPAAAPYVFDRQWSAWEEKEMQPDGSLILSMDVKSVSEIISWLLSFGPEVKVLDPAWLKHEILESVKKVVLNYQDEQL